MSLSIPEVQFQQLMGQEVHHDNFFHSTNGTAYFVTFMIQEGIN